MTPSRKTSIVAGETPRLFVEPGLLKELLETMVQEILQEEVEQFLGAEPYERRHEAPDDKHAGGEA